MFANCSVFRWGALVGEGLDATFRMDSTYLTQIQAALRRAVGLLTVSSVQYSLPEPARVSITGRSLLQMVWGRGGTGASPSGGK